MEPGSIVEAFDEGKNIALGFCSCRVFPVMDELGLEGVEEALHRGVVEAVGLAAHRGGDAGGPQDVAVITRGILDAAIGMMDETCGRALLLDRGFVEGNHGEPGQFVVEKAFAER